MKHFLALAFLGLIAVSAAVAFDQINISFSHPPNAPYLIGQPEMKIDAEEFTTIILPIKSDRSGTARLFWASSYDPQMNEPKSIWFFIKQSADFKDYVFHVKSQNPSWAGFIDQLLVYPDGGPQTLEIGSAQASTGNLFLTIQSGWQEFWDPRGRMVIGSTINTIQSPNLFGRSINVYLYWLLGLLGAAALAMRQSPIKIVWLAIGLWLLLEISSMYSQYLVQARDDWKYVGKNPIDQLIMANYGDFYPFIQFCQKQLPVGASYDFRIGGIYNDIKTRYYLMPHRQEKGADFLIVYDAQVEPQTANNYMPWQNFRAGAFIMKRGNQ